MNKFNQADKISLQWKLENTDEKIKDTNMQKEVLCSWIKRILLKSQYYPKQSAQSTHPCKILSTSHRNRQNT